MVFFCAKVLRKVQGNWTFVVVTDRVELDDQIAKTFKARGAVSEAEGDECHAESGAHLARVVARKSSLRFHAHPKISDPGNALRPAGRDCAHGRSASQPI